MIRFYVFPIIMDLLVQAKRCFDFFLFQNLILAIFYLQYMLWMLPLTI